jgi:hypothetical protein
MLRNLVPVQLNDNRTIEEGACNNQYVYFIDMERSAASELRDKNSIDLELKKIGVALQLNAKRLKKSLASGTIRIRFNDTNAERATNGARTAKPATTYSFILEYNNKIETHFDVPIPTEKEINFSKITVNRHAPQPFADVDTSVLATDIMKGPAQSVLIQSYQRKAPIRMMLPPVIAPANADEENKFENDKAILPIAQRNEALGIFGAQQTMMTTLEEQSKYNELTRNKINANQMRLNQINMSIQANLNVPDEAKADWQTATAKLNELNQQQQLQNTALDNADSQLDPNADLDALNLRQTAEGSLVFNYGIYKGHQKHLLKPAETGAIRALQYTALQYFNGMVTELRTQASATANTKEFRAKSQKKIIEFNEKFKDIAEIQIALIKELTSGVLSTHPEAIIRFDTSLATRDLTEIAAITNNLITVSVKYQGHGWSRTLGFLKTNLETTKDLKDKFLLTPTSFGWLGTISDVNKKAPYYDSRVLDGQIADFQRSTRQQRVNVDNTETKIQDLETAIRQAEAQTAEKVAALAKIKTDANAIAKRLQIRLEKDEAEFKLVNDTHDQCLALSQKHAPLEVGKYRDRYANINNNIAVLREEARNTQDYNLRIQATNSIAEAQSLDAQRAEHTNRYCAIIPEHEKMNKRIRITMTTLQETDKEALRLEAEALEQERQRERERAQAAAQALIEQRQAEAANVQAEASAQERLRAAQNTEQQAETNRQREATRQETVIETAKKIIHILSAVDHWHKQVRLWGGVNVTKPGGGTTSVPLGISEMIKEKQALNPGALSYEDAEKLMLALQVIGKRADQRGGWNCCYPVRKSGTTGALYNFVNDFKIAAPILAMNSDADFDNIYPGWKETYGVSTATTPLLQAHDRSPPLSPVTPVTPDNLPRSITRSLSSSPH